MNLRSKFPLFFKVLEASAVFFAIALVNINSLARFRQFPEVDNYSDNEPWYLLTAVLTLLLMWLLLREHHLLTEYLMTWKNNVALILFLVYALSTILWTVYIPATLYKWMFLLFSSLSAGYIALRYGRGGVVRILTWAGAIFTILSILVVAYFPFVGIMQNKIFFGSWNGIFWHRNHTGNIFAFFNMVFLLRFLLDDQATKLHKIVFALLYLLSAAMVFGSRSATGVFVFLFLHLAVGLTFAWLKLRQRLASWHYYLVGFVLLAGFLVFITNTGFFFGLLGRTANMTGRVPVWQDLFGRVFAERPVFGYGYGALWMQKRFRIDMEIRHGWSNQVYFADNGFFDILLNTGLIGFALFLLVYLPLGIRSARQAIAGKSWLYFIPLLTFLYVLIGNLTYSFLLEVDQFVWLLLVIMVFLTTSPKSTRMAQP
jgi:exopolysaccharide production protein ExoQ